MAKNFSKQEAIKFGWQTMKQNFWFFFGLLAIVSLVYIIPEVIADLLGQARPVLAFAVRVVGFILDIIVTLGLIKISLNFCDSLKSKVIDVFSQYLLFFRVLFASILYYLIVIGGFILLILPGIYLSIRLQFYRYFIVDKNSGITESLKRSWAITKGSVWNLFLFGLLLGLINLAGFLVFLVGLFATVPTTMVALASVYRKLFSQTEPVPAQVAPGTSVPPPPPPPAQPPMVSSSPWPRSEFLTGLRLINSLSANCKKSTYGP